MDKKTSEDNKMSSRNLKEVFSKSEVILNHMGIISQRLRGFGIYDRSEMNGLVVIPDNVACSYLKAMCLFNTHFAPHHWPGYGMGTGDIKKLPEKNGEYLFLHLDGMMISTYMLHLSRPYELSIKAWGSAFSGLNQRLGFLLKALKECEETIWGIKALVDIDTSTDQCISLYNMGSPGPEAVSGLAQVAGILKNEGFGELSIVAEKLHNEFNPYCQNQNDIYDLGKQVGYRGTPYIRGNMLCLSNPPNSDNTSIHFKCVSNNIFDCLPNILVILMVGGQVGNEHLTHLGGGEMQGEHFIMSMPYSTFFPKVQTVLNSNIKFEKEWNRLNSMPDKNEAISQWTEFILPLLERVALLSVPSITQNQVLGFSLNLKSEPGVALLRPIISMSCLKKNSVWVNRSKLAIEHRELRGVVLGKQDLETQLKNN